VFTNGFDPAALSDHFLRHGLLVRAINEGDYELRADDFVGNPRRSTSHECTRANGDFVRFDPFTNEYAVVSVAGIIRTYFIAEPIVHGYMTNYEYFNHSC